jgi:phosphoglycerate-specific signal transduction histidine kinase
LNFVNNFSDVNAELLDELEQDMQNGKIENAVKLSKDIRENEMKINLHGKKADAIIKSMLQHSRTNSGIKEPTDLNAIAEEYFRLAYHGLRAKDKFFRVALETSFDQNIGKINRKCTDIGRVLLNLLINAFYAVSVKSRQVDKMVNEAYGFSNYNPPSGIRCKISVKDNGNWYP